MLFLLKNPNSKHGDILKNIDVAPSTLSYHLRKLVKKGVIEVQSYGREKIYNVINEKDIIRFLIRYKPSEILRRSKETWTDFYIP